MGVRYVFLLGLALAFGGLPTRIGTGQAAAETSPAGGACRAIRLLAGSEQDAGPLLQACLDATPAGGILALARGRYLIATPVKLRHPLSLTTQKLKPSDPPCFINERRCAVLRLAISPAQATGAIMPFDVASDDVRLDHLVFVGMRRTDPGLSAQRCASDKERPLAGGLRITGDRIVITRSVFRDMSCYTALEYGSGVGSIITYNAFIGNGTHNAKMQWADGLTIHSAQNFIVENNNFIDNTDVQLIFGSCVNCRITDNDFTHSGKEDGGSFAEIMLQAWPRATSGNYTDTQVSGNKIDCGAMLRCGFGIMIGSTPWYAAPAFGGAVFGNHVRGAMLALNVEDLTGPMVIEHNELEPSTGTFPSMCGPRRISDVSANISLKSRPFLSSMPTDLTSTAEHYCILNFAIAPRV